MKERSTSTHSPVKGVGGSTTADHLSAASMRHPPIANHVSVMAIDATRPMKLLTTIIVLASTSHIL